MEQGFLVDRAHANSPKVQSWHPGEPRKLSFWVWSIADRKAELNVETFRCPACGYLESYAP